MLLASRAVVAAAVGSSWAARRVCHVHQSSQHALGLAHCRQIHGGSSSKNSAVIYQPPQHITSRAARFVVACASDSKQLFFSSVWSLFMGTGRAQHAQQTFSSSS